MGLIEAFYDDGEDLTGYCTAGVTGGQLVAISADQQAGGSSGVSDSIVGGNISVAPCGAGLKALGVAQYDQTTGNLVGILRGTKVVPIIAGGAITHGTQVQSDASGHIITLASGVAVGYALADASSAAMAKIALYP